MCGRYRLTSGWSAALDTGGLDLVPPNDWPEWDAGSDEVFPRTWQPVLVASAPGAVQVQRRRWGFHRTWPDKTKPGKWVKRELINAVGETAHKLQSFRAAFQGARCLVPLSAWWEWPTVAGVKTRALISMPARPVFLAAGLYETSKDNKTGEPVDTFTIVTVQPNDYLTAAHDRAPLLIDPADVWAWLEGGAVAQALIHAHPDNGAFAIQSGGSAEP